MSQIRSDILYQRRIKEVTQADQQMKRLHIATPIASDNFDYPNEPLQNIDEELLIVSDDDNEKDVNNVIEKDIVDEGEPSTELINDGKIKFIEKEYILIFLYVFQWNYSVKEKR